MNNMKHGKGELWSDKGKLQYRGDWVADKQEGMGEYTWSNGDTYSGPWKQGYPHSKSADDKGVFAVEKNFIYEGSFRGGR